MREALHCDSILDMHARARDYFASIFDVSIALHDTSLTVSGCPVALTRTLLPSPCHLQLAWWLATPLRPVPRLRAFLDVLHGWLDLDNSPNRNCWGSQFILQRVDGQDDLGT